jgi:ABC-type transporter Mla subunit MlaD
MPGTNGRSSGEKLLRRLRRLTARVDTVKADDRAQLIALLDDVEAVRQALVRECAQLDEEIRRAAVRITAITAYARGPRFAPRPGRSRH